MQNLITFATIQEAAATIKGMDAKKRTESLYQTATGFILITGMGALQTTKTLYQFNHKISYILNLGCAGALQTLPLFSVHEVATIQRHFPGGSENAKTLFFKMYPELSISSVGKKMLCSEISINQPAHHNADLVDMESYFVAHFAIEKKIPCKMHKCISDFANEKTPQDIQANVEEVSKQLALVAFQEVTAPA